MPSKNEIMANPGSGALPGGGQAQTPFGSASPDAIFGSLTQGMPQVTQQDIQAAITPISGRGPIQMPSYFTTPRAQVQPPAQMNREQVIGAGNGRAQGIGNTVSAATRLIGNIVATKKLQKQEADATRVQQLLSAQYSVDSTQQQLKGMKPSDPGYAELQKQAKDSQTLIAGLMQDPKFVKQVEKGFQVSLTDPSQNKTPDHNLVQRGIDLFKKKHQENISQEQAQQMAQRFSQSQPRQLMANAQAQQNLQMKMAQQQSAQALFKDRLTYMGKLAEAEGRVDSAKLNAYAKLTSEQMISDREFAKEANRRNTEFDLAKYKAGLEENVAQFKSNLENKDSKAAIADYDKAVNTYSTQRDAIVGRVAQITHQMATDKDLEPNVRTGLQSQLDDLYRMQKLLGDNFEAHRKMMLANLQLEDPQATLTPPPPPQVGMPTGTPSGGSSNAGTATNDKSGGINPITGHPWHKSTPTIDKLITEGLFNLSRLAGGATSKSEGFEEWLRKIPGRVHDELKPDDGEDKPR